MQTRVALAKCDDYAAVGAALDVVMAPLGGWGAFVKPGQTVLVKPNLLSHHAPDEAVTSHPELLRAILRRLKTQGVTPVVADCPANAARLDQVWDATGVAALCREELVPLLNLEKAGARSFEVDGMRFSVATPILEADVVINVPKVKTHMLTTFTGAVKNMYGAVPGFQKTSLHKVYPRPREFGELVAAVYGQVKPALSIADAVVGMEGDGPSAGQPIRLGFLAASADAAALDAVLCGILRIDPRRVCYLGPVARRRLGETDGARIETVGPAPDDLAPPAFRMPGMLPLDRIPLWLLGLARPLIWHRPRFGERCVHCGECVRACPTEALRLRPGRRPVLTPSRCVECCCCHEICPARAVEMAASPLLRFGHWLRH